MFPFSRSAIPLMKQLLGFQRGASEAVTYVFNYKNIPFHKLHIACCVCPRYVREHTLVSFVRIRPGCTGELVLAVSPVLQF